MDCFKLIEFIQSKSELWDKHNRLYHNREVKKKAWLEVAQYMKYSDYICRQKWNNLRDVFRKELKKINSGEISKSKWMYFQHLYFLKDILTYHDKEIVEEKYNSDGEMEMQAYTVTLKEKTAENSLQDMPTDEFELETSPKNTDDSNNKMNDIKTEASLSISAQTNKNISMNDIEKIPEHFLLQRNSASVSDDNDDGDYYFVMSLLPYMKKTSAEKKMLLRMRMMQVVYEEIFQGSICTNF